jgi:hypothetical protein
MDESRLLSRLREICLALPEVRETTKWGHPTFQAAKKMFAVLDRYGGKACVAFWPVPSRQLHATLLYFPKSMAKIRRAVAALVVVVALISEVCH